MQPLSVSASICQWSNQNEDSQENNDFHRFLAKIPLEVSHFRGDFGSEVKFWMVEDDDSWSQNL